MEGRRTRYIGPLRLYLTFSLLFFFLVAVLPGGSASFLNITTSEGKSSGWSFKADATPKRQQAAPPAGIDAQRRQEIGDRFFHNVPRVIFALMPAAALITLAVFRRRQPYFVAHLYYSVHLHAFVFAVLTVDVLLNHAGTVGDAIGSLAVVGIFPYHFVAMRRFFGEPWRRTWWKGTLVTLVYLAALTASMALLVMFSLQGATGTREAGGALKPARVRMLKKLTPPSWVVGKRDRSDNYCTLRPSESQSSTGPCAANTLRIFVASPTAMITILSSGMYLRATLCTSSAVTAAIFSGYVSQ